jgi:methylated-DNA-[protein]-cysteine S-methyltransferase
MDCRYSIFDTNWGYFGLFGTDKTVLRASLPAKAPALAKKTLLADLAESNIAKGSFPVNEKLITDYYKGIYVDFAKIEVELDSLTPFAKEILTACRQVTYGQTASYGLLAELANHPNASRAVGTALAGNPIPLIIPCHRIIKSDGQIGNFSAGKGSQTKQKMLDLAASWS